MKWLIAATIVIVFLWASGSNRLELARLQQLKEKELAQCTEDLLKQQQHISGYIRLGRKLNTEEFVQCTEELLEKKQLIDHLTALNNSVHSRECTTMHYEPSADGNTFCIRNVPQWEVDELMNDARYNNSIGKFETKDRHGGWTLCIYAVPTEYIEDLEDHTFFEILEKTTQYYNNYSVYNMILSFAASAIIYRAPAWLIYVPRCSDYVKTCAVILFSFAAHTGLVLLTFRSSKETVALQQPEKKRKRSIRINCSIIESPKNKSSKVPPRKERKRVLLSRKSST